MEREPTAFENKVYDALCMVPAGKVVTYKTLGAAVGCNSGQAIGNAMRRNPSAPEVPCHRVISSQLKLAGYMGKVEGDEVQRKRELLAAEGVDFDPSGNLSNPEKLIETW